jgi:hypothetical protein
MVEALNAEIARLEEARRLLAGSPTKAAPAKRGGSVSSGKRKISAAGRARIAAAQKKRWAKAKRVGK